jgi:hypothetical protein
MTDTTLDRRRSVTADDQTKVVKTGDFVSVVLAPSDWGAMLATEFNVNVHMGLPPRAQYNRRRDALLRGTLEMEPMWAAALTKATAKQVALGWLVDDDKDIKTRAKLAQSIIELYDGDFESGIQRGYQDYNTTDNGQWIEIIRASKGPGSRVTGLAHLDSLRVTRTGDPEVPGIYTNLLGREKPLYAHQCISITAMPSADITLRGMGLCPASIAWPTICKMQALELYFTEKVTGRRNLAIHLIRGITMGQLKGALETSEASAAAKGHVFYRGALLIPGLDSGDQVDVTTIPLAEIPDGFEIEPERARADNIYANAIGIFVGEIKPLTGQGLGNGQQAALLEEQAAVSQMAAWRKQFATAMKQVTPKTTVFRWSSNDDTDRKRKAEADGAVVIWLATAVEKLGLSPAVAQQILLDNKILAPELAPKDATAGGTLTDEEQAPSGPDPAPGPGPVAPPAAAAAGVRAHLPAQTKATRRPVALDVTDDVIAAANALRAEVNG